MKTKTAVKIISAAVATAGIIWAAVAWYQWKHPKAEKVCWYPENTEFMAVINPHEIIEELVLKGQFKGADSSQLRSWYKESGISFTNPCWVFGSVSNRFFGLAMDINNTDQLREFLKKQEGIVAGENDSYQWQSFRIGILHRKIYFFHGYNGAIFTPVQSIFFEKHKSFLQGDLNKTVLRGACKPNPEWFPSPWFATGDHEFSLSIENAPDSADGFGLKFILDGTRLQEKESRIENAVFMHLPVSLFIHYAGKNRYRQIQKSIYNLGIDTAGFPNPESWVTFALHGTDTAWNENISYSYDEDFNRVEVKSQTMHTFPGFAIQTEIQNPLWWDKIKSDKPENIHIKIKNLFGIPVKFSYKKPVANIFTSAIIAENIAENERISACVWVHANRLVHIARQSGWIKSDTSFFPVPNVIIRNENNSMQAFFTFKKDLLGTMKEFIRFFNSKKPIKTQAHAR